VSSAPARERAPDATDCTERSCVYDDGALIRHLAHLTKAGSTVPLEDHTTRLQPGLEHGEAYVRVNRHSVVFGNKLDIGMLR
jgi:hypothetical protein